MAKNPNKVLTWLDNGIYPGYVLFSVNHNYKEITTKLKKLKNKGWYKAFKETGYLNRESVIKPKAHASRVALYNTKLQQDQHYFFIIFPEKFEFEDEDYVCLAHEILHICQFFLQHILDRDVEYEGEAYYHSHLMHQCLEALRGKNK
jgi:hypothetical protein